jgi:acetyltransferase-like isoleucine patch superfamily enzyme
MQAWDNMKQRYTIYPGVQLGANFTIEDFCIIGIPPFNRDHENVPTVIGDGAIIRSHTVIYAGNQIGKHFQTGNKANIREMNQIGNHVSVGTLTVIEHHTQIGNNVRIHSQAFIPEYSIIEDHAWIGPNVVLTNAKYPASPQAKKHLNAPVIKKRAKIGANATILPGIIIGKNVLIGAGTVVVRDVPDGVVVAGNPGQIIGSITNLPY